MASRNQAQLQLQRYTWEDTLVKAQNAGIISNGDLLVCIKLAKAINWTPKDGRPPGLYWKNDSAFIDCGVGRSTYYKHRRSLLETGFFVQVRGNLLPSLPDECLLEAIESLLEKKASKLETVESIVETEESLGGNPLSEDTCSEDESSEDLCSSAAAPAPIQSSSSLPSNSSLFLEESPTPLQVGSIEPSCGEEPGSPQETDAHLSRDAIMSRVAQLSMRGRHKTDYGLYGPEVIEEACRRVDEEGYRGDLDALLEASLKEVDWW